MLASLKSTPASRYSRRIRTDLLKQGGIRGAAELSLLVGAPVLLESEIRIRRAASSPSAFTFSRVSEAFCRRI